MKNKKYCPLCAAKKLIAKGRVSQKTEYDYDNGVALTPPMGWSSWNLFRNKISEELIKEIADAMKDSGLAAAGYRYVNIDDCWQASERDAEGRLQWDKITFPSGIKALSEYVNSRGISLGIYSSNGTHTCEDYPASLRNERIDAETLAQWGIEYFKYDFCHNVPISSVAPKIIALSFARDGEGAPFIRLTAKQLRLTGNAFVAEDATIEDKAFIDGLDSGAGSILADIQVPQAGEYILNLDVRKDMKKEKFVMARVNGEEYHLYYASRKSFTAEGKLQTKVKLSEGNNTVEIINPVASRFDSAAVQYKLMGRELRRATALYAEKTGEKERPIIFSICEWGLNRPWKWGAQAGNLWRTTPDIKAQWLSIMGIYEANVRLYKYAGPGKWNDPDMLEVGNGELTKEENKAHFSLWCMMAAPLILGNDIRQFLREDGSVDEDNYVYKILTNKDMIAINQDPLGVQCKRIKAGLTDVLIKPLKDSAVALCVLNKSKKPQGVTVNLDEIADNGYVNLQKCSSGYSVYDVWDKKYSHGTKTVSAAPEAHGVKVYIIKRED